MDWWPTVAAVLVGLMVLAAVLVVVLLRVGRVRRELAEWRQDVRATTSTWRSDLAAMHVKRARVPRSGSA